MEQKLEELIKILKQEPLFKEYFSLEKQLLSDKKILNSIELYQKYQDQSSKKQLDENKDYQRYLELEKEVTNYINDLNDKLKELTKGRKCYENN